ncbi:hypothetical protein Pcinc_043348 [Petrolisthes cinctipes]|uniref:Uncharacterized protein n=1 Tax=Petrolisthes cinctipes TaxID=88211 RepID=A0AAE1BG02_PETCI|nr:hypothetical protein Pcinc_043348 [Petrolisthes cinctipes]
MSVSIAPVYPGPNRTLIPRVLPHVPPRTRALQYPGHRQTLKLRAQQHSTVPAATGPRSRQQQHTITTTTCGTKHPVFHNSQQHVTVSGSKVVSTLMGKVVSASGGKVVSVSGGKVVSVSGGKVVSASGGKVCSRDDERQSTSGPANTESKATKAATSPTGKPDKRKSATRTSAPDPNTSPPAGEDMMGLGTSGGGGGEEEGGSQPMITTTNTTTKASPPAGEETQKHPNRTRGGRGSQPMITTTTTTNTTTTASPPAGEETQKLPKRTRPPNKPPTQPRTTKTSATRALQSAKRKKKNQVSELRTRDTDN